MSMPTPEREHTVLASQLDAYLDGELDDRTAQCVAGHLAACPACRRALALSRALRDGLAATPVTRAPPALTARIRAGLAEAPSRRHRVRAVALAAVAAALLVALGVVLHTGPRPTPPVPMVQAALQDYRSRLAQELPPADPARLAAVARDLPFPLRPLAPGGARPISVWRTTFRGEPVAAFAYRWGDRVVVEYLVSEALFFRQPRVREAVARRGWYVTRAGATTVVARPTAAGGALLVGELTPRRLESLHD